MRPLSDIEADAAELREDLREWSIRHPLKREDDSLHIPNCLRIRAFACRQRRLEEEAGDSEVTEVSELVDDIVDMLDAVNDQEYTVALDDELEPRPTAWQWGEMAERYEEMGRAQEAFEWWQKNKPVLTVPDVQPLAEAIAAVQQRFNRLLFRVGARDPFQQALFDELRTWAREDQCYLYSLRPKVPMAELVERAITLEPAWEHAKQPLLEQEERGRVVDDVIRLVTTPGFGSDSERDEKRLHALLAECKTLRIPSADRKLRDALLPWASFVEGDDRFRDILREITLEWDRRQEIGKADETADQNGSTLDELSAELVAVRKVTSGKRCLMLGGSCRDEIRTAIQEALAFEDLVWPATKPMDPLSKYDSEIRHADIVVLLTRFSRKEWRDAREACERDGKKFVQLNSGYGVADVVHQFYTELTPEGAAGAE
jgi:hypothetical protein